MGRRQKACTLVRSRVVAGRRLRSGWRERRPDRRAFPWGCGLPQGAAGAWDPAEGQGVCAARMPLRPVGLPQGFALLTAKGKREGRGGKPEGAAGAVDEGEGNW
jgi:hypothetical protein